MSMLTDVLTAVAALGNVSAEVAAAYALGFSAAQAAEIPAIAEKKESPHPHPPFKWPTTRAEIETLTLKILSDAEANLAAVAAIPDDQLTYENCIAPLTMPPNWKTNPELCTAKFMQHCSTIPDVRASASEAGQKFAAFKAGARARDDVYKKVAAFQKSEVR